MESAAPRDAQAGAQTRPYEPSWLDRVIGGIVALPGPTWLAYAVLAAVAIVVSNAVAWASDLAEPGALRVDYTYWGLSLAAVVWLVGYLGDVAGRAFDGFRPALRLPDPELAAFRYSLTVIPARPALLLTVAGAVVSVGYYLIDPSTSEIGDLSAVGLAIRGGSDWISSSILLVIVYQLLRQARLVSTISAAATSVDPFQPGPLYAFSELTSRTGIALVVLMASTVVVAPPPAAGTSGFLLWLPWVVGIPMLAAATFVLPLFGIHRRLVAEKQALEAEAAARLRDVLEDVNRAVDARDDARADGLAKLLAAMLQQREVVSRLPTWPWSSGTLRSVVSAIFLPLVIFLLQRLVSQFV
jgi:hypothetical protein